MRITLHLCMPEGDGSREGYADALSMTKRDNQRVIAAMLREGIPVVDTVGELGLQYVPAKHRFDASGRPLMDVYGLHDMVERGTFSCADAAAYEAAVLEEKYGVIAETLSVPQGDNDFHAVYVTRNGIVDPTANFLAGRPRPPIPARDPMLRGRDCRIEGGRVVCNEPPACHVDSRGVWNCPDVPGLTGRRERIGRVEVSPRGQAWARTKNGAAVPVRRPR